METVQPFDFNEVPHGWALCFSATCARSGSCLRHLASHHVPRHTRTVTCVYTPEPVSAGCDAWCSSQPVRFAYGFGYILTHMSRQEAQKVRLALRKHLGNGGTYYRYLHGEQALTPVQQKHFSYIVQAITGQREMIFDHYANKYWFKD